MALARSHAKDSKVNIIERMSLTQISSTTQPSQGTQDPLSSQLKHGILDLYLGKARSKPVYPNATRYEKS